MTITVTISNFSFFFTQSIMTVEMSHQKSGRKTKERRRYYKKTEEKERKEDIRKSRD